MHPSESACITSNGSERLNGSLFGGMLLLQGARAAFMQPPLPLPLRLRLRLHLRPRKWSDCCDRRMLCAGRYSQKHRPSTAALMGIYRIVDLRDIMEHEAEVTRQLLEADVGGGGGAAQRKGKFHQCIVERGDDARCLFSVYCTTRMSW